MPWTLDKPEGSMAELDDPTAVKPTFTPDIAGDYRLTLTVTDFEENPSGEDEMLVGTSNLAPVADAGADKSAHRGETVVLDGSGSSDTDEDYPLRYSWTIISKPDGSAASLSDPGAVNPSFTMDKHGDYRFSLVVVDALGAASESDEILVSTLNAPPVADAGLDQSIHQGRQVTLDGSGSSDPDGDYPLTYDWAISIKPDNSEAVLSDPTAVNPSFTADLAGDYVLTLVVKDALGNASVQDEVKVNTYNAPPMANAGPDQAIVIVGSTVTLNGDQSYDDDGDGFTYEWTLTTLPDGSNAALSGVTTATPSFIANVHGDYVASLTVTDQYGATSAPDTVTISFGNVKPVADAGDNQSAVVGNTVILNGAGSSDDNHDILTYEWGMVSIPPGSASALSSAKMIQTSFVPDLSGTFVVALVVNDGFVDSDSSLDSVAEITVVSRQTVANDKLGRLITYINDLDADKFEVFQRRHALTGKIGAVLSQVEEGQYAEALDKLQEMLKKTDGCTERGSVDMGGNRSGPEKDWIIDCDSQRHIYTEVQHVIGLLQALI